MFPRFARNKLLQPANPHKEDYYPVKVVLVINNQRLVLGRASRTIIHNKIKKINSKFYFVTKFLYRFTIDELYLEYFVMR